MTTFRWSTYAVVLGALVTWIGCSQGADTPPPAASQGGEATPVEPSDLDAQSDERILGIVTTVDGARIDQGQLALERAQSPQVRDFAASMVRKHGASKDEIARIATTNDMKLEAGSISRDLSSRAALDLESLSSADPEVFDEVYLELQTDRYLEYLSLLNGRLLPDVDNEALLHELQAIRDGVETRLAKAEKLAAQLK